ncbi:hypothetical protein N0V90_012806 [Kalmusia sp. IMI 367209]|nr:hypothetical protein N0V90_012806 [Kalmusia sp. IMI 367209]
MAPPIASDHRNGSKDNPTVMDKATARRYRSQGVDSNGSITWVSPPQLRWSNCKKDVEDVVDRDLRDLAERKARVGVTRLWAQEQYEIHEEFQLHCLVADRLAAYEAMMEEDKMEALKDEAYLKARNITWEDRQEMREVNHQFDKWMQEFQLHCIMADRLAEDEAMMEEVKIQALKEDACLKACNITREDIEEMWWATREIDELDDADEWENLNRMARVHDACYGEQWGINYDSDAEYSLHGTML